MPGLNFVKQNQPAMQPGDDAIPEAKVAFRGLLRRKRLAMTSEVVELLAMTRELAKFLAMTDGALVIAKSVRHCERSEAIPEKVHAGIWIASLRSQ